MSKKKIVIIVIACVAIIGVVVGAAYAFVSIGRSSIIKKGDFDVTTGGAGTIALTPKDKVILTLTNSAMRDSGEDVDYYASNNGVLATSINQIAIAEATFDEAGSKNCSFVLNVTSSGDFLEKYQTMTSAIDNEFVLTVDGNEYDFHKVGMPTTISGTISNLTKNNPKTIDATLKFKNRADVDQTAVAGASLTISFTVNSFECN